MILRIGTRFESARRAGKETYTEGTASGASQFLRNS
jgi:hypothetical protein